jgi:hypothetical protein
VKEAVIFHDFASYYKKSFDLDILKRERQKREKNSILQ